VPFTFPRLVFLFFLWDDEFTTARSAGSVNGTAVESTGQTRSVSDSNSVISIAGDQLVINGSLAAQNGYITALLARTAGRAFAWSVPTRTTLGAIRYGVATTTLTASSQALGFDYSSGVMRINDASSTVVSAEGSTSISDFAIVMFATGGAAWVKISGTWKLTWVLGSGTNDWYWKVMGAAGSASTINVALEYLRIRDLSSLLSAAEFASVHTSAVSDSDYTASAALLCDLAITAPSSLAGTAGLKFRKSGTGSGKDYWKVWFNSSGDLLVQRFAADVAQGSPVTLATGVISASATRTIRVIADGANMDFYTLNGSTWTKRGSTQSDSVLSSNTIISPFADTSWASGGGSVGQLDAYPRTSSLYNVLDL